MNNRPIKTTPTGEPPQKEDDDKKIKKDDFQAQNAVPENSHRSSSNSEIDSSSNSEIDSSHNCNNSN